MHRSLHYALKSVVPQGNFQALRSRMTEGGGKAWKAAMLFMQKVTTSQNDRRGGVLLREAAKLQMQKVTSSQDDRRMGYRLAGIKV